MTASNKIITLTYKLYPESKGYSVKCLDWHCVYTQGDTINECKKHAIEATKLMLPDLKNGTLQKSQYPKLKAHKKSKNTFSLTFDIQKNTKIKIVPVVKTERERIRKSIEKGLKELKEMKRGKRKLRTLDELLNE